MLFSLPPAVCFCHLSCVSASNCSALLGKVIIWGGRSSFQSVQGTDVTGELCDLSTDIGCAPQKTRKWGLSFWWQQSVRLCKPQWMFTELKSYCEKVWLGFVSVYKTLEFSKWQLLNSVGICPCILLCYLHFQFYWYLKTSIRTSELDSQVCFSLYVYICMLMQILIHLLCRLLQGKTKTLL